MGVNRVLHTSRTRLLWGRGSALFGLSGPDILDYGELSTIPRETQAGYEPRSMGSALRGRNRRRNQEA